MTDIDAPQKRCLLPTHPTSHPELLQCPVRLGTQQNHGPDLVGAAGAQPCSGPALSTSALFGLCFPIRGQQGGSTAASRPGATLWLERGSGKAASSVCHVLGNGAEQRDEAPSQDCWDPPVHSSPQCLRPRCCLSLRRGGPGLLSPILPITPVLLPEGGASGEPGPAPSTHLHSPTFIPRASAGDVGQPGFFLRDLDFQRPSKEQLWFPSSLPHNPCPRVFPGQQQSPAFPHLRRRPSRRKGRQQLPRQRRQKCTFTVAQAPVMFHWTRTHCEHF